MKKTTGLLFVIGVMVVLVLVNLISLDNFLRLDLTRDSKFTLSTASVDTVSTLDDVLTVSAYFTEGLPTPYAQHARYVKDLLEEYRSSSNGNFAFEFIDPAKEETAEDKEIKKEVKRDIFGRMMREPTSIETRLSSLGVQPVEIRILQDDQQQTKRAYMGVVVRYQDKHEVIPIVKDLPDLEKNLTSLMLKLTRSSLPKLGIIHSATGPSITKLRGLIGENMSIEDIDLSNSEEINDDIDVLLIVGSGDHFGDNGAQKIDKFLRKGKSASFLLDRYQIDPKTFQQKTIGDNNSAISIFELLESYGVKIGTSYVADASCASLNMQEERGGFSFSLPVKYPFIPELLNMSFESQITKGLSGVILPFISNLEISENDGFITKVLANSSQISWLEKEPFNLDPRREWGREDIKPSGPYDLIVEGRGVLPNSESEFESRIVVIGTSSFLWDDFLSPANQMLALNMVDWMLSDSSILEMRSKEFSETPIYSELSDTVRQLIKYGNILGIPLLLIIYGFIRWRLRERRRNFVKDKI